MTVSDLHGPFDFIGHRQWPERVTVYVSTFNQKDFIARTLESVLAQSSQDFHILVNDDASTDGTREIVADYAARHPEKISALLWTENQFSQGRRVIGLAWPHFRGEFVALLDGDDEWLSPDKLETQLHFMDANPGCALCQTMTQYWDEQLGREIKIFPSSKRRKKKLSLLYLAKSNFVQTSATMIRLSALPAVPDDFDDAPFGDHVVFSLAARNGWIGLVPRTMVKFRVHNGNMWFNAPSEAKLAKERTAREYISRYLSGRDKRYWDMVVAGGKVPLSFRIGRLISRLTLR